MCDGVVLGYVAIAHAFGTITTRHILEIFQAVQWTTLHKIWASDVNIRKINLKFKNTFLFRQ